mgnify:CR=1 FL=1
MIATLLVGMLCVYLLSFTVMFLLIGRRLQGGKMGTDAFAVGNLLLGSAYVLQLLEGPPGWSAMSVANHALTLCALLAYGVGGGVVEHRFVLDQTMADLQALEQVEVALAEAF